MAEIKLADVRQIAPIFSTSTACAVGDYVIYQGLLYRCIAPHAAGAWNASHFTQTDSGSEFKNIKENISDVETALETKAEIDGYYDGMTVGDAEQLVSTVYVEDSAPYNFRTSGGSADISNREYTELIGGTINWNQLCNDQFLPPTTTKDGVTFTNNGDGSITVNGTATANVTQQIAVSYVFSFEIGHKLYICGAPKGSSLTTYWMATSGVTDIENGMMLTENSETRYIWIAVNNGVTASNVVFKPQIFDLTAMFGSTIADYIYSLEQANAGAGVAWFRKYFPKPYYSYNAGTLMSVKTPKHVMTGFNQWDGTTVNAYMSNTTGNYNYGNHRSTDYIRVLPNTAYYIHTTQPNGQWGAWFDVNKNYISGVSGYNQVYTTPPNAAYGAFTLAYQSTVIPEFCLNLSWSGYRNGEYEEYVTHEYDLDSDLELRGLWKLDSNNELYFDGDKYESDGTVTRKYGIVDMGTLTWNYHSGDGVFYSNFNNCKRLPAFGICSKYIVDESFSSSANLSDKHMVLGTGYVSSSYSTILVKDSSYTGAATFKTAMSGVYLVYELATETTEEATPYAFSQVVDDFGTEEFVDEREVAIPVGHNTKYPANLRDKLQHLPDLAEEDGTYVIAQNGSTMTLIPDPNNLVLEHKADVDGYYEDLTAGSAEQLISTVMEEDSEPYNFRTAGGDTDIGNRLTDTVVGGTIAWNQLVKNGNFADTSNWGATSCSVAVANNVATITKTGSSSSSFYQNIPKAVGHKYFATFYAHGDKAFTLALNWGNAIVSKSVTTTRTKYGIIFAAESAANENFNLYVGATVGLEVNDKYYFEDVQLIDLTQMFGSTIADYIYSLEQTTAGAGVAWFKKLFPKDFYEFNSGELLSVNTSSHDTVGFNQWDEEWENGRYSIYTGEASTSGNGVRNKNKIKVLPNTEYHIEFGNYGATGVLVLYYDADENYISYENKYAPSYNANITTPSNAHYICFNLQTSSAVTTYNHDICINLSWSGYRNGEYEPYIKRTYPLDSSLTLRGIPKLDSANKLYYDGDTYESDGTVTRRYGIVDLGTLNWQYTADANYPRFSASLSGGKGTSDNSVIANIICTKYPSATINNIYYGQMDKVIAMSGALWIRDSAYTDVATFKQNLSGQYLVYELATPTTEEAEPFQSPQVCDDFGTEEYIDYAFSENERDVAVPVGHVTEYQANLRDKLQRLPDMPSSNGDFVVRYNDRQCSLVPYTAELPSSPTDDGTYVLKATKSGSTVTYTWVAE